MSLVQCETCLFIGDQDTDFSYEYSTDEGVSMTCPSCGTEDMPLEFDGYNIKDFTKGMADCKAGVSHVAGNGESYDAGYGSQYTLEQIREGK